MISCWDQDPKKRPTFDQLKSQINEIKQKISQFPEIPEPLQLNLGNELFSATRNVDKLGEVKISIFSSWNMAIYVQNQLISTRSIQEIMNNSDTKDFQIVLTSEGNNNIIYKTC